MEDELIYIHYLEARGYTVQHLQDGSVCVVRNIFSAALRFPTAKAAYFALFNY